jgi:hypothetical protein
MAVQRGDFIYRSPEQPCGHDYSAACGAGVLAFSFARLASFEFQPLLRLPVG